MGLGSKAIDIHSLLNLEINTIVKDRIEAMKMPEPGEAIKAVKEEYLEKLRSISIQLIELGFDYTADNQQGSETDNLTLQAARIKEYIRDNEKDWLESAQKNAPEDQVEEDVSILHNCVNHLTRIEKNLNTIEEIAADNPEPDKIHFKDLMQLRKIWEIGTEDIVMQTIVQADGDVISRIVPKYANDVSQGLLNFHELGVKLSIKHWGTMLEIVTSFFGGLVKKK